MSLGHLTTLLDVDGAQRHRPFGQGRDRRRQLDGRDQPLQRRGLNARGGQRPGQRRVRAAPRPAEFGRVGLHHALAAGIALGEPAVGIQGAAGLGQQAVDVAQRAAQLGRQARGRLVQAGPIEALVDAPQPALARVDLRFGIQDGVADHARPTAGQAVDQLRVQLARPGPAAEVVDALVVDGDHRDIGVRAAVRHADAGIVELAFQCLPGGAKQAPGANDEK